MESCLYLARCGASKHPYSIGQLANTHLYSDTIVILSFVDLNTVHVVVFR